MKAKITAIGAQAIDPKELILILFNQSATESLREYAIIQEFEEPTEMFELAAGDSIAFGDAEYKIDFVGRLANEQLKNIGHVTVVFGEVPAEDAIVNGLYVTPYQLPELIVGTTITYKKG